VILGNPGVSVMKKELKSDLIALPRHDLPSGESSFQPPSIVPDQAAISGQSPRNLCLEPLAPEDFAAARAQMSPAKRFLGASWKYAKLAVHVVLVAPFVILLALLFAGTMAVVTVCSGFRWDDLNNGTRQDGGPH
jgi:hypothetical protein